MRHPLQRFARLAICSFFALLFLGRAQALEIEPIGKGPFEVATTNMEVLAGGEDDIEELMKGKGGIFTKEQYIATRMAAPESSRLVKIRVPDDSKRYGKHAGKALTVLTYVVYPTSGDNPRAAYTFPYKNTGDNVFPHMQRNGDKPIFEKSGAKYPLIVCSHGYTAHGLWELDRFKHLASHGFIVVSVFHGDGRYNGFENLKFRPLAIKQVIDQLLADPDFGPAIDEERIGVSGSSFGGYTVLACMGAKSAEGDSSFLDPRIKAGFGLVPFTGAFWAWPFGKDYVGMKGVKIPYLAVYAEKDSNVPPETVLDSIQQCSGESTAVMLPGEAHLLTKAGWNDVPTWELLFFKAWLKSDAEALRLLRADTSVRGGTEDKKQFYHSGGQRK